MNNKINQEHYLVVYQEKEDLLEFLKQRESGADKYVLSTKDKTFTTLLESEGKQQQWYYVRWEDDYRRFMDQVAGHQFVGVCYLDGDYPANVFNYSLSRCRGGIWEVDKI